MIPPTADFRERILVRDALAAWRLRLQARGILADADKHYEAIMRHAHAAWDRESRPTLRVPATRCERCGAQKPLDGTCVSCVRVRA